MGIQNQHGKTTGIDADIVRKKVETAVRMTQDGRVSASQADRLRAAAKGPRDSHGQIQLGESELSVFNLICRLEHREQQALISRMPPARRQPVMSRVIRYW